MQVVMDTRWIGSHGIGRFAAEMHTRLGYAELQAGGNPASPIDPLLLALACARLPRETLFFSPGYSAPLWSHRPFVLTVHDLNHIDRDENSSALKRVYYQRVLRPACRRAAAVLTVSDFSRNRIVAWAGVDPRRVFNVGNGVGDLYRPDVQPHAPGYPYLLCVSNRKLHKNESGVITAFARSGLDAPWRLVLTGDPDDFTRQCISQHHLDDRVVFTGRVDEGALPAMYRGAAALIFPSLYEGFGLPVIEAFACGTPVITSTTTSLPEVAGDAAILVDPLSTADLAAAIQRIVSDVPLREALVQRGLQRAALFTWPAVADRVERVLSAICGGLNATSPAWPAPQPQPSETPS